MLACSQLVERVFQGSSDDCIVDELDHQGNVVDGDAARKTERVALGGIVGCLDTLAFGVSAGFGPSYIDAVN